MKIIVGRFFLLPFWLRVVIILFLLIVVVWMVFGKVIRWVLSFVPFVLNKIFRVLYLLIEIPVTILHKKFGSDFYKIENWLSNMGERVDAKLDYWYKEWHSPKKSSFGKTFFVYILCVFVVVVPSVMKLENKVIKCGELAYTHCEAILLKWLEEREWYNYSKEVALKQEVQEEENSLEKECFEETLVVSGVSSSLLVRDIPSIDNCTILTRLYNDDIVIWRGQLVFSEAENSHVESWAKVETVDGMEGWCRLFYLHPSDYKDKKFCVINNE